MAPMRWRRFDAVAGLSLLSPSPDGSQLLPNPKSPSFLCRVPDPGPPLAWGSLGSKKNPQQFLKPRQRFRPRRADTAASSKLGCGSCHRHAAPLSLYPRHSRSPGPPLASSGVCGIFCFLLPCWGDERFARQQFTSRQRVVSTCLQTNRQRTGKSPKQRTGLSACPAPQRRWFFCPQIHPQTDLFVHSLAHGSICALVDPFVHTRTNGSAGAHMDPSMRTWIYPCAHGSIHAHVDLSMRVCADRSVRAHPCKWICLCTCGCMHAHRSVHAHAWKRIRPGIQGSVHARLCRWICLCTRGSIHAHVNPSMHMCAHRSVHAHSCKWICLCICGCMHAHRSVHAHAWKRTRPCKQGSVPARRDPSMHAYADGSACAHVDPSTHT